MKRLSLRAVAAFAVAVVAAATLSMAAQTATSAPIVSVPTSFDQTYSQLSQDVAALTGTNANVANLQVTLHNDLRTIANDVLGNKLCPAVAVLGALRTLLISLGAVGVAVDGVVADVLNVLATLLGDPRTVLCGGASVAASPGAAPVTALGQNDTHAVVLHLLFPTPNFAPVVDAGAKFLAMTEPGMQTTSSLGEPQLPTEGFTVAVPTGATVTTSVLSESGYNLTGISLEPTQPSQPVTPTISRVSYPLSKDATTYALKTPYPSSVVTSGAVGSMRDLHIAPVAPVSATYTPASKVIRVMTAMDLKVTFSNNIGSFGSGLISSAWEQDAQATYQKAIINYSAVTPATLGALLNPGLCGEQMVIVAGDADLASANALATARTHAGVLTTVVPASSFPSGTQRALRIRDYLVSEFNDTACIRPSYLLLVGDADVVPTFSIDTHMTYAPVPDNQPTATDAPYGFLHHNMVDNLNNGLANALHDRPDLHVARIAGTHPQVAEAVRKIIAYTTTPATLASFYNTFSAFTYFQACDSPGCADPVTGAPQKADPSHEHMTFVSDTEDLASYVQGAGKSLDVQAVSDAGVAGHVGHDSYGHNLPPYVKFPTNVSVSNTLAAGRFLVYQASHGSWNGWAEPLFTYDEAPDLTNVGLLPVIWQQGCDIGNFDQHPNLFPGSILGGTNSAGQSVGAVAMIANTRLGWGQFETPLWAAMGTTTFPELANQVSALAGTRGGPFVSLQTAAPVAPVLRLGDELDQSKFAALVAPYGGAPDNAHLSGVLGMEVFGDPSMVMFRDLPKRFDVSDNGLKMARVDATHVKISLLNQPAADGATVTLTNGADHYLDRGTLTNGSVVLSEPSSLAASDPLGVILSRDGWVSASPAAPVITSLSPPNGPSSGGPLTINGVHLSTTQVVTIGSASVPFHVVSDGRVDVTLPPAGPSGSVVPVRVTNRFATSAAVNYTYDPAVPGIASISPLHGPATGGTIMHITGTNLAKTTSVQVGNSPATFAVVPGPSPSLTVTVPAEGADLELDVPVLIRNTIGQTQAGPYHYDPVVTSVVPATGYVNGGTTVLINGSGFYTDFPDYDVRFGSRGAIATVLSNTQIRATVPTGATTGSVDVTVTVQGSTSSLTPGDRFTYTDVGITYISPTHLAYLPLSRVVSIVGVGLTGVTGVDFGPYHATNLQESADGQSLIVNAPLPPDFDTHTVHVVVHTTHGDSAPTSENADLFTFDSEPSPAVTGLSQSTGYDDDSGYPITVSGTGFAGTTEVDFGGVAATSFHLNNDGSLTVTVPPDPAQIDQTVDIIVHTTHGTSTAVAGDQFSYVSPPPLN